MATRPSTTAAAKACRTFIFFSLSLPFFFPRFFLSLARPFYSPPRVPVRAFLFIASRPTTREGARRRRWRWRKKRLTQTLLFASFVYSPYFPPRPPRNDRAAPRALPSFAALFLLLLLHPFFFHFFLFFSHAIRIPSPDCNSAGLSAPRTAVYFYCDVLPPLLPQPLRHPLLSSQPPDPD